jgi:hypothetical protein
MRDEIQEQLRNENEKRDKNEKPKHTKQFENMLRERLREIKALHTTSERNQNVQKYQRNQKADTQRNRNQCTEPNQNQSTKSNENQQQYNQQRYDQQRYYQQRCNQQRCNQQEGQRQQNQGNKLWIDRSLMGDPQSSK